MTDKKLLRRKTYCRRRDYYMLLPQARACDYHRVTWSELSLDDIEQHMAWQILQNKEKYDRVYFSPRELGDGFATNNDDVVQRLAAAMANREVWTRQYLYYLMNNKLLYNPNWKKWSWRIDQDQVQLRWEQKRDWEPLGTCILERDY